jgi:hypothetical protein
VSKAQPIFDVHRWIASWETLRRAGAEYKVEHVYDYLTECVGDRRIDHYTSKDAMILREWLIKKAKKQLVTTGFL